MSALPAAHISSDRVAVLVDAANLRGALEDHLHGARIDIWAFRRWASSYGTPDIHWFQGAYDGTEQLFGILLRAGVHLHRRRPKVLPDGRKKADMDVELALVASRIAGDADTAIIVSGDSDLVPVAEYLQRAGLRVINVALPEMRAFEYFGVLDRHDILDLRRELADFRLEARY